MRMPDFFYSCHPKQALAGVGQPGGRAGVVTPRGGSNPAPGPTLPRLLQYSPSAMLFFAVFEGVKRRLLALALL